MSFACPLLTLKENRYRFLFAYCISISSFLTMLAILSLYFLLFEGVTSYDKLELIEEINYCQIQSKLSNDFHLQLPEANYYISFNGEACQPYLEILDFESLLIAPWSGARTQRQKISQVVSQQNIISTIFTYKMSPILKSKYHGFPS